MLWFVITNLYYYIDLYYLRIANTIKLKYIPNFKLKFNHSMS